VSAHPWGCAPPWEAANDRAGQWPIDTKAKNACAGPHIGKGEPGVATTTDLATITADRTLEEEIASLIELGERDPHTIAQTLIHRQSPVWLATQLIGLAEEIIAERARQRLGSQRRQSIARVTPRQISEADALKLRTMWVPSPDGLPEYVRVADATPDHFDRRAAYLERMASHVLRQARWCRDVAEMMRAEKITKAGKLRAFPPLPDEEQLELPGETS